MMYILPILEEDKKTIFGKKAKISSTGLLLHSLYVSSIHLGMLLRLRVKLGRK